MNDPRPAPDAEPRRPAQSSAPNAAQASARRSVALVFGGRSSEHAVSCATAASVLAAVDRDRYDVIPIGIASDGRWVLFDGDPADLRLASGHIPSVDAAASGPEVALPLGGHTPTIAALDPGAAPRELAAVDVVFPLLHGPFGEDGTLQGLLDLAGVRYVGSGVFASAAMMDKAAMKVILRAAGLRVGPYQVVTDRDWQRDPAGVLAAADALGLPVFVKPARAGSSMGITRVDRASDLAAAIEVARRHDPKVLVEAAVVGREIECGVLEGRGTRPPRTSELGEAVVVSGHAFYDFEAKYLDDADVRLSTPAEVPPSVADEIRRQAAVAFDAAGCEGLARVDFFLTPDEEVVVNEVNTMPGFTPSSMYPRMWQASGLSYAELIDELIELALARRVGLR